ncbi:50S ribosome-binding GTPase [Candidatus Woesearchaeota archaeon]|nr:50S ribosome-binding GTPase [Candidatus Woesearchaeota archaeon]MBW3022277.1 50S ribosome-binding GTPase [Candidatus Woesearchaeota archaeon]
MNFQSLKNVEDYKFFLDVAFSRAKKAGDDMRSQKLRGTRLDKSRKIELAKLDKIKETLKDHFNMIIKSYPAFDDLPEFYKELIKATLEYKEIKKSLAAVNWAKEKVAFFHNEFKNKILKTKHLESVNQYRRQFYGRISSVVRQIRKNLEYLEYARKIMRDYPAIKTGMKTVAIFGFPNVGKTTLLSKLTKSRPEIKSYPFTTKGINIAYMNVDHKSVQIVDTPGTLNRFEKMNNIEKVAYLALKYLAEDVVYVFDITEPFPLKDQVKLYKALKRMQKKVYVYLSKTDVLKKEDVEEFRKKYDFLDVDELKNVLK